MASLEELKLFATYASRFYLDNGPGLPEEDEGDEEEEEEKLREPTSPC